MPDIQVISDPDAMRDTSRVWRCRGETVALVPTMGFLHEGHLSLVHLAARLADHTVISIFVNPAQFGPNEDLDKYPRDEEVDLRKAAEAGAELAYVPVASTVYPDGYQTYVEVQELSRPLCGQSRPIHFQGVATVVTKLFNVVQPDIAVFGGKDYQQLQVVRRLTRDLELGVEIVAGPTVREPDGLAMSSRNAYLTSDERRQATCLVRALRQAWIRFDEGERNVSNLLGAVRGIIKAEPDTRLDYAEIRHPETLEVLETITDQGVLALAVFLGQARLIDNTVLGGEVRP